MLIGYSMNSTIIEAFEYIENRQPEAVCFTFGHEWVTYSKLGKAVRKLAAALSTYGLKNKTVLIVNKTSFEFLVQFLACEYVGAIPVPSYHPDDTALFLKRFPIILEKGSINYILTNEENKGLICAQFVEGLPAPLTWLTTEALQDFAGDEVKPDCADIAFIQFSSGSTGDAKGVIVTHANLLFCVNSVASILMKFDNVDKDFWGFNWLPLYHDMGLIGAFLLPLLVGFPMAMIPTKTFIQDPYAWLNGLSRTKAKMTLAPNFAYDRCVDNISDEQKASINLSNLRVAFNGGEHVSPDTITRFNSYFESCGLIPEAMCPAYGLAEATLVVTASDHEGSKSLLLDKEQYSQMVVSEAPDSVKAISVISSGRFLPEINVVIVDPADRAPRQDMQIGEVMVSSASVAYGYCGNSDSSDNFHVRIQDYEKPFLQTGDLGFVKDQHLFITGRLKDLVIINGKNFDPKTIEEAVAGVDGRLREVANAVFSIGDNNGDRMVLMQEIPNSVNVNELREKISAQVEGVLGIHFSDVVFLPIGTIIRTSIGKVSRGECRNMYLGAVEK